MLRLHLVRRSLRCLDDAAQRRSQATSPDFVSGYQNQIRSAVRGFYGPLPCGRDVPRPVARLISQHQFPGCRLENLLFESFPGWEVNATLYLPDSGTPPYPAVVVPVGHSGKQFPNYQLPCQYFARRGLAAICFDPPGQAGEKQPGNDHFVDGVREYLVARTSSRYFVADALRCIDYLETRQDIDLSQGVAMTGVSGGGTTTSLAVHLDERITLMAPSCCLASLCDLDIRHGYAGCPETHMWQRYSLGVDETDLLCAAAPIPCLLMAGALDEVFRLQDTRALADAVESFYSVLGYRDEFHFFVDESHGHGYSLVQAKTFVEFLWQKWFGKHPPGDLRGGEPTLLPDSILQCHPRTDVHMRSLVACEVEALSRQLTRGASAVLQGVRSVVQPWRQTGDISLRLGDPFPLWVHDWYSACLQTDSDVVLPATLLRPRNRQISHWILHFDENGRHDSIQSGGVIGRAISLLDRETTPSGLLSVDLRGWGDSSPAVHPYELASWGSVHRNLAYMAAALGDSLLAMRVRDGLAALQLLHSEIAPDHGAIILSGNGWAGVVALHVAALAPFPVSVVAWNSLSDFASLASAPSYPWKEDAFVPCVLLHYDLPELVDALPAPAWLLGPRDGSGRLLNEVECQKFSDGSKVSVLPDSRPEAILQAFASAFSGRDPRS